MGQALSIFRTSNRISPGGLVAGFALLWLCVACADRDGDVEAVVSVEALQGDFDFNVVASKLAANTFTISLSEDGVPSHLPDSGRLLHAHILPEDHSVLYHDHPRRLANGSTQLVLDYLTAAGAYDIWLEVTENSGRHVPSALARVKVNVKTNANNVHSKGEMRLCDHIDESGDWCSVSRQLTPKNERVSTSLVASTPALAGQMVRIDYLVKLDDVPIERFGRFVGVPIHSWAISRDGEFFTHDHGEPLGNGRVDVRFTFPLAGEYSVFIQPAVIVNEGKLVPVSRFEISVE